MWEINDRFILKNETGIYGPGVYRLLDTDFYPVLPYHANIKTLITRADVLHSWTIPSLGVKADANPGRLNQVKFTNDRPGGVFGQCSEICGANHRFIPIFLDFIDLNRWLHYINNPPHRDHGI